MTIAPKCSGSTARPAAARRVVDDDPARGAVGGRREAGEPAVTEPTAAAQLALGAAAEPHVGRLLPRLGPHGEVAVVEVVAVVVDVVLGPQPPDQGQRLVEDRRTLVAGDAERLVLRGDRVAEPERGKRPAAREPVEAGPGLREQRRVAAGEHLDARAELQARRAAGGERQPDQRGRARRRRPARTATASRTRSGRARRRASRSVLVAQPLDAEAVPDADLHVRKAS